MKILIIIFSISVLTAREPNYKYLQIGLIKYGKTIQSISKRNGINPQIVIALISYENAEWDADAVSITNDYGLMQIHIKDNSLLNAKRNLEFGIKKLAWLVSKFGLIDGLESWNKGVVGMKRIATRYYAKNVLKFYKKIKRVK